jgi:hypothetical protein
MVCDKMFSAIFNGIQLADKYSELSIKKFSKIWYWSFNYLLNGAKFMNGTAKLNHSMTDILSEWKYLIIPRLIVTC